MDLFMNYFFRKFEKGFDIFTSVFAIDFKKIMMFDQEEETVSLYNLINYWKYQRK